MPAYSEPQTDEVKEMQAQLGILARVNIDPRLQGKIDLSGIVNETLAEAFRHWESIQDSKEEQRRSWLRTAFMNNLRDALRKLRSRGAKMERSLDAAVENSSARIDVWLAGDESTPSAKVARQEQSEQVAEALSRLPERQREAIILQRWHGWKLAEIAEHFDCTAGAVAGRENASNPA